METPVEIFLVAVIFFISIVLLVLLFRPVRNQGHPNERSGRRHKHNMEELL